MGIVLFGVGLVLLVLGADLLVRGAARLAVLMGIPSLIIGLTIVSFGTSAPELAVSLKAGLTGSASIAVGNVLGSNIFNTLFILGLCALAAPLVVARQLVRLDVPIMIAVSVLTWLFAFNGVLSRVEGAVLFGLVVAYTCFLVVLGKRDAKNGNGEPKPEKCEPWPVLLVYIAVGLALLVLGARWLVDGASALARAMGVSELMIGLTVVAAGTSLPEAATSIVASLRGQRDIAVGNVVGSNIFNLLVVLGLTSCVAPAGIDINPVAVVFDFPIVVASSVICLPIFFSGAIISRLEGALLFGYYVAYTALLILKEHHDGFLEEFDAELVFVLLPATGLVLLVSLASEWPLNRILANVPTDLESIAWQSWRQARRLIILVVGATVVLAGIAMLVLPGPAVVVIPAGLAILGTEFVWARRLLSRIYSQLKHSAEAVQARFR